MRPRGSFGDIEGIMVGRVLSSRRREGWGGRAVYQREREREPPAQQPSTQRLCEESSVVRESPRPSTHHLHPLPVPSTVRSASELVVVPIIISGRHLLFICCLLQLHGHAT